MISKSTFIANKYIHYLLIIIGILICYSCLPSTFFQQDEWSGFGKAIYVSKYGLGNLFRVTGFHFFPLTSLFYIYFFYIFKLHYEFYAYFSIGVHIINSLLVYELAFRLSKNKLISLCTSLFFGINIVATQAVNWYAASLSVLPATFFALLSLVFALNESKHPLRNAVYSVIFLTIGLGFKEDVIPVYILLFLIHFLRMDQKRKQRLIILSLGLVTYLFFRLEILLTRGLSVVSGISGGITIPSILYNILHFPSKIIRDYLYPDLLARAVTGSLHSLDQLSPWYFLQFDIGKFIDNNFNILIILISIIGIYTLYIICIDDRFRKLRTAAAISVVYLLIGYLPITLLPRGLTPESRHYYLYSIFSSLAISIFFYVLYKLAANKIIQTVLHMVVLLLIILNCTVIISTLNRYKIDSNRRISFLYQFTLMYPSLPNKVAFYNNGNNPFFQSGLGQTLLVQSHVSGLNNYADFLGSRFLWDIKEQNYKEIGNRGFGYFYDLKTLKKSLDTHNVQLDNVIAFEWDDKRSLLIDVTKKIKEKLYENE